MAIKWTFFLGVHNTVTPLIVSTCELEQEFLQESGTFVISHEEFGELITRAKRLHQDDANSTAKDSNAMISKSILGLNNELLKNESVERVLLVEEDLLGSCRVNTKSCSLYPNLQTNMKAFPLEFDNPWNTLCFCIKPYDAFFEDCLTNSPRVAKSLDLAVFKSEVLKFSRTWVDVIEDITNWLPNVNIKIWRADQTKALRQPIEELLFGVSAGLLSQEALLEGGGLGKLKVHHSTIWTLDEVERCVSQYERDWYHIQNGWADYVLK
jgi:hypothetical protein